MVFGGFFFNMVDACIFAGSRLRDAENLVVKRVFLQPARIILTNKKKRIKNWRVQLYMVLKDPYRKVQKRSGPAGPAALK